jgi:hypothetical protein
MRLPFLREPPPTFMERMVGRRRARLLRRRVGFAAMGLGLVLLRPKRRYRPNATAMVVAVAVVCLVVAEIVRMAP